MSLKQVTHLFTFYFICSLIFIGYHGIIFKWQNILQPRTFYSDVNFTNLTNSMSLNESSHNNTIMVNSLHHNNRSYNENIDIVLSCDIEQRPGLYTLINSILVHLNSNKTLYVHLLLEKAIDSYIVEQEFNLLFKSALSKWAFKFEIKTLDKYPNFVTNLKYFMRLPDEDHASHCYSIMTYARIYLPLIWDSLKKALFFDIDIIVQHDLSELFAYDTTEKIFWCVHHLSGGNRLQYSVTNNTNALKYTNSLNEYNENIFVFNAGVFLYNLSYWRDHNMTKKCENIFRYNRKLTENFLNQGDQSVLLLLFLQMRIYYTKIGHLDTKWNTVGFGWSKVGNFYLKNEISPVLSNYTMINNSYILHWNGKHKPWLKHSAYNTKLFLKYIPQQFNQEIIYNFNPYWLSYKDTPEFNGLDWYIIKNKTLLHSLQTAADILKYIYSHGNNLDVSDILSWNPKITFKNQNCFSTTFEPQISVENVILNGKNKSISIFIINVNRSKTNKKWLQLFTTSKNAYVFCAFSDGTTVISHSIMMHDLNSTSTLAVVECKIPDHLISYVSMTSKYSQIALSIMSPSHIKSIEIINKTSIQDIPVCCKYINATTYTLPVPHIHVNDVIDDIDDIHIFVACDNQERIGLYTLMNSVIINHMSPSSSNRMLYFHILVESNEKMYDKEIKKLFKQYDIFKYEIKSFNKHPSYNFLTKYFSSVKDVGRGEHKHTYLFKHMNFARFYFTDIFDLDLNLVKKALYLDVDIIVETDVELLYDYTVNSTIPILAINVTNGNCSLDRYDFFSDSIRVNKTHQKLLNISDFMIKNSKGFYAGIYLYDLRYWFDNKLTSKYEYYVNLNYKYDGKLWNIGTQPLINLLYIHGTIGRIYDSKWHLMGLGWLKNINQNVLNNAFVLHWNGAQKPWAKDAITTYKHIWLKYLPQPMKRWNFSHNGWDINIYDNKSHTVKIFEIGVTHTGTESLAMALQVLGYKTARWNAQLAAQYGKTKNVSNILTASRDFDAFTNGPWHTIDFRIWYHKYPNSKFILLEPDEESWLRNYELWFSPKYNINNVSIKYLDDLWIKDRNAKRNELLTTKRKRYQDAIQFFNNNNQKNKLLIINISHGFTWQPLCKFLNKSIPKIIFPIHKDETYVTNLNKFDPLSESNILIFQIGFPHMGTTTLKNFFECNGIPSIKGPRRINHKVKERLNNDELPFLDFTDTYSYFGDFRAPWVSLKNTSYTYFYEQLVHDYPTAKYILNIRNVNHWLKGTFMFPNERRNKSEIGPHWMATGVENMSEIVGGFERDTNNYKTYICETISYFYRNNLTENIILYDIEQDLPSKLVKYFSKFGMQLNVPKCFGQDNPSSHHAMKFMNNTNYQHQMRKYNKVIEMRPQFSVNNPAIKSTYIYLKNICNLSDNIIASM